jgi:hypothetical protein
MGFKPSVREYNMSDAALALFASNMVVNMTRDTVEFAVRGVTAIDITDFQTLENSFEVFPPDSNYRGLVTIETDAKNAVRDTAFNQIQLIVGFIGQEWGIQSGQYKRLDITNIANDKESVFLVKARLVVTVATEYLPTLSLIGLMQGDIDALSANAQLFEDKLNDLNTAENNRDIGTRDRINLGNEVMSEVQKFARIGKSIWLNIDEAKYDDYVISPTVHSSLGKVQNLTGAYSPASGVELAAIDLAWDAVTGASGYELFVSIVPIGQPPIQYALLDGTPDIVYTHSPIPNVPSEYYYKVRAVSPTETGADSDVLNVTAT